MDLLEIKSFKDIFFFVKEKYKNRVVFRWLDESETICEKSYHDFCVDILRGISYLKMITGKHSGVHLAFLARNSYDYIVMFFACLCSGTIAVPLNIQKSSSEIIFELNNSETDIILHDGEFLEREIDFADRFDGKIYEIDRYKSFQKVESFDCAGADELATIYFTSGTTSDSKGVMLSQRNILASYPQYVEMERYYRLSSDTSSSAAVTWLLATPLYHVMGFGQLLCAVIGGGTVNLNCNARYFFRDLTMLPSNIAFLTPIYVQTISKKIRKGNKDFLGGLNTICYAGAPIQMTVLSELKKNGIQLMQGYGLTEVFSVVTLNCSQEDEKLLSIGKECCNPLWGDKCCIMDSELCISGESLMLGYYNNPDATSQVIDQEGWFHTGDLAKQDDDGYYYLTGRAKNLIILSGGENVNPEELELLLLKNEDIIEAVVKERNNRIISEVYCSEGKQASVQRYICELNRSLPMYKHISGVEFQDKPFDKTSTGKIIRRKEK